LQQRSHTRKEIYRNLEKDLAWRFALLSTVSKSTTFEFPSSNTSVADPDPHNFAGTGSKSFLSLNLI
jgi:hypothetical protein